MSNESSVIVLLDGWKERVGRDGAQAKEHEMSFHAAFLLKECFVGDFGGKGREVKNEEENSASLCLSGRSTA